MVPELVNRFTDKKEENVTEEDVMDLLDKE